MGNGIWPSYAGAVAIDGLGAELLAARGHPDRVIGKVIGGNFQRLFAQM